MRRFNQVLGVAISVFVASVLSYADECQMHSAYATAGTVIAGTASGNSAQNGAVAYAIFNPFICTSTGVSYIVATQDSSATNYYGFALVGVNGNATQGYQYATTGGVNGPTFTGTSTNVKPPINISLPWTNGPIQNLPVGLYMLVLGSTCSSSCAQLWGDVRLGQFFPFIYADTSTGSPWGFSQSGFSGFSSATTPSVSISLSTTATQTISGTTATVTLNTTLIGHIFKGATISVQGVTTSGLTALNCVSCNVVSTNTTTGVVVYTLPSSAGTHQGTVNSGATLSVSPILVQEAGAGCGNNTSPCFVPPTVLIY